MLRDLDRGRDSPGRRRFPSSPPPPPFPPGHDPARHMVSQSRRSRPPSPSVRVAEVQVHVELGRGDSDSRCQRSPAGIPGRPAAFDPRDDSDHGGRLRRRGGRLRRTAQRRTVCAGAPGPVPCGAGAGRRAPPGRVQGGAGRAEDSRTVRRGASCLRRLGCTDSDAPTRIRRLGCACAATPTLVYVRAQVPQMLLCACARARSGTVARL